MNAQVNAQVNAQHAFLVFFNFSLKDGNNWNIQGVKASF